MNFKTLLAVFFAVLLFSCNKKEESLPASQNEDFISISKTDSVAEGSEVSEVKTSEETTPTIGKSKPASSKALQNYFQSVRKTPQVFTINASKESKITGAEKTTLTFPPNAFVSARTGKPVSGNITIKLTEYYQLSDMILANLSTTTNGKLLETGGMFYVEATADGEPLELQNGKSYAIEFPEKSNKPGMEIYNGQRDKNGNINWTLDEPAVLNAEVDEPAVYPGGYEAMTKFIENNFQIAEDDAQVNGTIMANFVVQTDGNVSNIKIVRGLTRKLNVEAIRVIKSLGRFTPAKRNGVAVKAIYSIPIKISNGPSDFIGRSTPVTAEMQTLYEADDDFLQATRLGWINCDRLWKNSNAPEIDLAVTLDHTENTIAYLIFHRYKSVLLIPVHPQHSGLKYDDLPSGENVTLVVIQSTPSEIRLAVKETVTSSKRITDLKFTTHTKEIFKTEIKKRIRLDKA